MRLASFRQEGQAGFGRVDGEFVVPMGADLVHYLQTGEASDSPPLRLQQVRVIAPIPKPQKVVCIGLNYRDHAIESGQPIPEEPILFAKFTNSVVGPGDVRVPKAAAAQLDYEAELCVVIGRTAREVSVSDAFAFVAGYTCANDLSARDLQLRVSQWTRGKAADSLLPIGPWLVTPDEIGDPHVLGIRCLVNGSVVQDSSTNQLIFGVAELVSFISQTMTLAAGDLIVTGTPPGVGFARQPPLYLGEGDEVVVEIERVGRLVNMIRVRP